MTGYWMIYKITMSFKRLLYVFLNLFQVKVLNSLLCIQKKGIEWTSVSQTQNCRKSQCSSRVHRRKKVELF